MAQDYVDRRNQASQMQTQAKLANGDISNTPTYGKPKQQDYVDRRNQASQMQTQAKIANGDISKTTTYGKPKVPINPVVPKDIPQTTNSAYYNELLSMLNSMSASNERLANAQNDARNRQIQKSLEDALRDQQSAYRRQRRDIIKSSGNMSGARVAGLTQAGNNYNNAVAELNRTGDELKANSNIQYLSDLYNNEKDKFSNKYNLYAQLMKNM